jgi:hypothetical protein
LTSIKRRTKKNAIASESGDPWGYSPKWSLSKHEAEADYHEHKTNTEMMSPLISAHEANDQNEQKYGHSQTDLDCEEHEPYQV